MVAELLEGKDAGKVAVGVTLAAEARPNRHRPTLGREGRNEICTHETLSQKHCSSCTIREFRRLRYS